MSLLLNIDTALDSASVCLAKDEEIISLAINENPKSQAAWLHSTVAAVLQKNGFTPGQLDGVAVSIGPGSYTGLRVGLAAAKGLCYALKIPLITIDTLKVMALAVQDEAKELICPLIDARRMEVFAGVYDKLLQEKMKATALIIDAGSFEWLLAENKILFCGNGSKKLQPLLTNKNATFSNKSSNASHLAALAQIWFNKKEFADLAYTEPLYIKEFYTPVRKS
jgi:tRNA threonylcarbamoyladenosine biosynthesis protein TsaB